MGKTYYYQVSEVNDNNAGYYYDSNIYTFIIKVIDNGDGTLRTDKTILKGSVNVTEAEFVNTYTTSDVSLQFAANKTLTGCVLKNAQFSYKLAYLGEDGKSSIPIEEVTNNSNGAISFAPLTYTQADMGKTFIYTVKEINDAKSGYEYDNSVYTITVKVIDNSDGTLRTEVTATKPGNGNETIPAKSIVFSNIYTARGQVQFAAKKELVGQKLSDKQFAFVLTDENGTVLQTVYNDADGNILFEKFFFNQDQLGEYHYKVYEVSGERKCFTYDKTLYFITAIVTDNGDGSLNTAVSLQKENGSSKTDVSNIAFVNKYQAPVIPSSPNTGDHSSVLWYSLLASLSLCILFITKQRKLLPHCSK